MATNVEPVPVPPFRLPVRDDRVNDLLLWKDPRKSGAVVAAVSIAALTIRFSTINFVGAVCYTLLAVVLGSFIWNNFASFTNRAPVPVPAVVRHGVTEEDAKALAERATPCVNRGLGFALRVLQGREPMLTGPISAVLYVIAFLSGVVTLSVLALLLTLALFSLPKAYELRHDEVDAAVARAREVAAQIYEKYLARIVALVPRGSALAKKEL